MTGRPDNMYVMLPLGGFSHRGPLEQRMKEHKVSSPASTSEDVLVRVSKQRNGVRLPMLLAPAGILPESKYAKQGDLPPLSHVQQLAKECDCNTTSLAMLDDERMPTRFFRKRAPPPNQERFLNVTPLPFEETELEFEKLQFALEATPKYNADTKQPSMRRFLSTKSQPPDLVLPPRKKRSDVSPAQAAQRVVTSPMFKLSKDLITGPLGSFLKGYDYIIFATTCRHLIATALWMKNSVSVTRKHEVPANRHFEMNCRRDYVCWLRSHSEFCQSMANGGSHAIQSICTMSRDLQYECVSKQIRDDVRKGRMKELRCLQFMGADTWLPPATVMPYPHMQCLEIDSWRQELALRLPAVMNLAQLRSFAAPTGSHLILPEILAQLSNVRHLDLLFNVTADDVSFPGMTADRTWMNECNAALCKLSNIETLRICLRCTNLPKSYFETIGEKAEMTMPLFFPSVPPFAATLQRLTMLVPYNTPRGVHSQTVATVLPQLRYLGLIFDEISTLRAYYGDDALLDSKFACTQITELHLAVSHWQTTDPLFKVLSGASQADFLRPFYPKLQCLHLTCSPSYTMCSLLPPTSMVQFSRASCRWPAEIHLYPANDMSWDKKSPPLTRHWLHEEPERKQSVNPQHAAELRLAADDDKESKDDGENPQTSQLRRVFKKHLLRGGVIKSTRGQFIYTHTVRHRDCESTIATPLDFKPSIDILYCTQPTSGQRDLVFKQYKDQLRYTVFGLDNCHCAYHDALRFLRVLCMLCTSEFVQSLMQLVFEKTWLVANGACVNDDKKRSWTKSWISESGHLAPAVTEAFKRQWTALTDGLKCTIEATQILLLNYQDLDLYEACELPGYPISIMPDGKQTERSFDVVLRLVLITASLTKALIVNTPIDNLDRLCDKIRELQHDMTRSCDRLLAVSTAPVDTLFDMEAVAEAVFDDNPNAEIKLFAADEPPSSDSRHERDVDRELYNMKFCGHKEVYTTTCYTVTTGMVENEDFIRAHVTEDGLSRWFRDIVWDKCDQTQMLDYEKVRLECSNNSPNNPVYSRLYNGMSTEEDSEATESDEDAFPNVANGTDAEE